MHQSITHNGLLTSPSNSRRDFPIFALCNRLIGRKIWGARKLPARRFSEVEAANFLPELYHCGGFAVKDTATTDGTLYHGRILDYACDWHLQDHAVLIIEERTGSIPFANVTFAGFIGSVTGMNAQHISIGEMGGDGQGHWAGTPMAILM
jgi:hypothetical protein